MTVTNKYSYLTGTCKYGNSDASRAGEWPTVALLQRWGKKLCYVIDNKKEGSFLLVCVGGFCCAPKHSKPYSNEYSKENILNMVLSRGTRPKVTVLYLYVFCVVQNTVYYNPLQLPEPRFFFKIKILCPRIHYKYHGFVNSLNKEIWPKMLKINKQMYATRYCIITRSLAVITQFIVDRHIWV